MSETQLLKTQEKVSVTEEGLHREVEAKSSIPLSKTRVQPQQAKEANGARPVATQGPAPSDKGTHRRLAGGIVRILRIAWDFLFSELREAYWLLDPDAECRSVGLQTVGHVDKTETEEHTDSETGTSYTYYVKYAYQIEARTHSARKKVGSLGKLLKGDALRVFYLTDDPYDRSQSPKSAIDLEPRALGKQERRRLEVGPGRIEEGSAEASNRSEPR